MNKYTYKVAAVGAGYFVLVYLLFTQLGHYSTAVALSILGIALAGLLVLTLIIASNLLILKRKKVAQRLVGIVVLFSLVTWLPGLIHYGYLMRPEKLMQFADTELIPALNKYAEEHGNYPDASPIWLPQGIDYCGPDANFLIYVHHDDSFLHGWTNIGVPGKWIEERW